MNKVDIRNLAHNKVLWIAAGLWVTALSVRLIYLYQAADNPTFSATIIDSLAYDRLARSIAAGGPIERNFFWQGILYPFFLSRIYYFTGGSILCAKIFQVLLGSVLCVLVFYLGRMLFDLRTAALAGGITALYGPLVFFEAELLATVWACFWSVLLIILFIKAGENEKPLWFYFVLGLCGGLSIITRATFLPFFIAAGIWLVIKLRQSMTSRRTSTLKGGQILLGLLAVLLPVCLLNYSVSGHFTFLPESSALNLYIGNSINSTEKTAIRPGTQWQRFLEIPLRQGAKDIHETRHFYLKSVTNYIITEPKDFLKNTAIKTLQFFCSREIPRNVDIYTARKYSSLLGLLCWKIKGFGFPFGAVFPFAALGLIVHRRKIPAYVYLFITLYPLSVIAVFVAARYRLAIIGILAVLASAGFWSFIDFIRFKRIGSATAAAVFLLVLGLFPSLFGPYPAETYNYQAEMYYCTSFVHLERGDIQKGINQLQKALELNPGYTDAYRTLGYVLYNQGQIEQAISLYHKALELEPKSARLNYYLALAVDKQGQTEQAVEYLRDALLFAEDSNDKVLVFNIEEKLRKISLKER
jgi:tetratricopeptide (TPR) repeat protein